MIDEDFVRSEDNKLIDKDVELTGRPIEVYFAWLKKNKIETIFLDNNIFSSVMKIYHRMYPSTDFSHAMLKSGIAIRDRIYKVNIPIIFGNISIDPLSLVEIDHDELNFIYDNYPNYLWRAFYGVLDLIDFGYAIDDLIWMNDDCAVLLKAAASNLSIANHILSQEENLGTCIQNICMTAELSIKAALANLGYDENQRKKLSHNLQKLASELIKNKSMPSDQNFLTECGRLPDYVKNRYKLPNFSKREFLNLFMRSQFIAAEATRRISNRNLIAITEADPTIPKRPNFDL
ncbi:TPA: hypothetical protein ACFP4Y_000780 [Neisseria bacilliformis]